MVDNLITIDFYSTRNCGVMIISIEKIAEKFLLNIEYRPSNLGGLAPWISQF